MPSVSLNSTYGRIAYPDGVVPTFDRTNWTVGVSVNVPILTGGRQRGDRGGRAAPSSSRRRLQRRQVEELAALDTRSAWAELVAARAAWEATAGTVQQAQRAYQIANVRFTNGVSTQLELSDRGCRCSRPKPTARWPRAICRWRAPVSRCCRTAARRRRGPVRRRRASPQPQSPAGATHQQQPQGGGQIQKRVRAREQQPTGRVAMTITG